MAIIDTSIIQYPKEIDGSMRVDIKLTTNFGDTFERNNVLVPAGVNPSTIASQLSISAESKLKNEKFEEEKIKVLKGADIAGLEFRYGNKGEEVNALKIELLDIKAKLDAELLQVQNAITELNSFTG